MWHATAEELIEPLRPRMFRFELATTSEIEFRPDPGTAFRSVFGLALKRVSCAHIHAPCQECAHDPGCLYGLAFESPRQSVGQTKGSSHAPHPIVIRVLTGDAHRLPKGFLFQIEILALGPLRDQTETLIESVTEVGRLGIGKKRGKFVVASVQVVDADRSQLAAAQHGEGLQLSHLEDRAPLSKEPKHNLGSVGVRFTSPTRIVRHGAICSHLTFQTLLRAILRRYHELCLAYGNTKLSWPTKEILGEADKVAMVTSRLRFIERERWSSRQKRTMPISGVQGLVVYSGPIAPFIGLLRVGEILHVGKGTILGQGRYNLEYRS